MKQSKKRPIVIDKDDFIAFLTSATPEEINQMIVEKGKPAKLIEPLIYGKPKNEKRVM